MKIKTTLNEKYRDDKALLDFVSALPRSFAGGATLFDKRNTIKLFKTGSPAIPEIVVKRYNRLKGIKKIIYTFFRKSKAERAFANGLEIISRGIDTPEPLAYIEISRCGLTEDCYFISRPTDFEAIKQRLNDNTEFDRGLADAFAAFAVKLHYAGILHHDLNSTNTIYRLNADGSYDFSVIDTNRMDFTDGCPPLKLCIANIVRFTRRDDLFEHVATRYADLRHIDTQIFVKQALEAKHNFYTARRRRKRLLHPTRKLPPK